MKEKIKTYLDGAFAPLGEGEDLERVKAAMLKEMNRKYDEYKSQGLTDYEAYGRVIEEVDPKDVISQKNTPPSRKESEVPDFDEDFSYIEKNSTFNFPDFWQRYDGAFAILITAVYFFIGFYYKARLKGLLLFLFFGFLEEVADGKGKKG